VNVRTVKYRFALCSLREVAAGQSLPSPSLNPLRNAIPGSLQVHFRATSAPPRDAQWSAFPSGGNEPPGASRENPHLLLVTTTLLANNVSTELIVPGSSAIRMLARTLVASYLLMVWPKSGALPPLIPAPGPPPIESRLAIIPEGICSLAALRFSRRCSTEDVPGINRMFGDF